MYARRYFGARYFALRFFHGLPQDAETPDDVYAWFPGDRILTGRRYEEYGEEEEQPRRRKRKPVEVIKDLVPLPPYVVDIPKMEPLPEMVPLPVFGAVPQPPPPPPPTWYETEAARKYMYWAQKALDAKRAREGEVLRIHAEVWRAHNPTAQYQQYTAMARARKGP